MPVWFIIVLVYPMPTLATDLVPVHIFTTKYDEFFASSCIPTSSITISSIHGIYVDLLKEIRDTDAMWLPIERRDLSGWHWLSGEFEGKTLIPGFPNRGHCVVLQARDMVLGDVNCNERYTKYLCQKTGSTCEANDGNCFVYDGTRYTIVVERGSWYEARAGCYKRGEQLASLPKANRRRLLEKIHEMTPTFPYIWVGLRRMDYFLVNRNTSVEEYKWRKGETCPCNSPHSCLELERTKMNTFFWKPRNCSESIHSVLCIQRFRPEEVTMRVQVTHGKGEETTEPHVTQVRGTSNTWYMASIITAFVISIICFGVFCWYDRRQKRKLLASREDNNKLSGELRALEMKRLKDIEEKERQLLASREDNNKLKGELEALENRRLKDIEEKERQLLASKEENQKLKDELDTYHADISKREQQLCQVAVEEVYGELLKQKKEVERMLKKDEETNQE